MPDYKVLNEDAFKLCASLPDNKFDLILTDPPYGTTKESFDKRLSTQEISKLCHEFARLTRSCVFIFVPLDLVVTWKEALGSAGMSHIRSGVWVKTSNQYNPQPYPTNSLEYWVYADKLINPKYSRRVIPSYASSTSPRMRGYKGIRHPHFKPISLLRTIIWNHTFKKRASVFDPFCGGGSVGASALLEGHKVLLNDSNLEFAENARYFCSTSELFSGHKKIGVSMSSNQNEKKKPKPSKPKRFSFTAGEVIAIRTSVAEWNAKKPAERESISEMIEGLKGKKGVRGKIKKNVKDARIIREISAFVNEVNKKGIKKGNRAIRFETPVPSKKLQVENETAVLLKKLNFNF